ncbi:MAG: hypothetical protein AB1498_07365 [bacterium]
MNFRFFLPEKRHLPGIFIVSLTTIFYEILLTRIFAVIIYYHFASLSIALALMGLSIGAVFYYWTQNYARNNYTKIVFYSFIFYCISFIFVFLMLFFLSLNAEKVSNLLNYFRHPFYRPSQIVLNNPGIFSLFLMWISFFFMLLPFVLSGYLSSLFLTVSSFEIEKTYFWNLFGASLGCILIFVLLPVFGGPNLFIFIAVSGIGLGFLSLSFSKTEKVFLAVLLIIISVLFIYSVKSNPAKINFVRSRFQDILKSRWNSYSYVAVYPFQDDMEIGNLWGLSSVYTGFVPPHLNMVVNEIDYTPIINFDGDLSKLEFLKYDLISLPYYLLEQPEVLIIGPGGGKEILLAKFFNSRKIDAAEINPLVIDFVDNEFKEFSGSPYSLENVAAIVDDGRNAVKTGGKKYDLITATQVYAYLDPVASAFSFTENYLYTKEAFIDYLDHLNPGGMITIIKPFVPEEKLRIFSLARASLETRGEKDFSKHLMLLRERGMNIFVMKKERFTQEEIGKVKEICSEKQFDILYYPGLEGEGDLFDFINAKDEKAFYKNYPLDVRPSTDDRPFFSTFLKPVDFWLGHCPKEKRDFPLKVVFTLRKFLLIFLFINLLLIAVFGFKERSIAIPSYFSFLGIAYMLVEITLIRKFIFLLGHPVYAVSLILFSLLLFSAAGSLASKKMEGLLKRKAAIFIFLFFLILFYSYPLDSVFNSFIPLPYYLKYILTIFLLFPLGFFMGMPFPLGINALKESRSISYVWAVNGASSVFGSLLALVLSMSIGYNLTILLAGLVYLSAGCLANRNI